MSTQVQFRRGTTTQNNAFTGAAGEISVDTDLKTIRLHDGTTAGGGATMLNNVSVQTALNKTFSTGSSWQGNAVGLGYGGTGSSLTAAAGAIPYSTANGLALNSPGTSGQVLVSGGTGAPTWVAASSISAGTSTLATTATNIAGGSAGQLIIQADTGLSTFITAGASGTFLRSAGAGYAPTWATADVTIGSTVIALGSSSATLAGLTSIAISGNASSSNPTTGALKVVGGVGIGENLNVGGNAIITGNLTVQGTTVTVNSETVSYVDPLIEIHNTSDGAPLISDDGKDIGFRLHYYKGADKNAALVLGNDTSMMEFYVDGTENSSGVFSGTYGYFRGKGFNFSGAAGVIEDTFSASTSGTSPTAVYTFAAGTYRSAELTIQVTNSTNYKIMKLLLIHDGTTVTLSENYGVGTELQTGNTNTAFTASISGGTLTLYATAGSGTSAVKGKATLIKV